MSSSSSTPTKAHRPRTRVPLFHTLPPEASNELRGYLDELNQALGQRDHELAEGSVQGLELRDRVWNVRNHGVVGDGVVDDAPRIRDLITLLTAAGGRAVLYFPPGTYKCNTLLAIDTSHLRIVGAGSHVTSLNFAGTGVNGNGFEVNFNPGSSTLTGIQLSGMHLIGGGGAFTDTGTGIYLNDLEHCMFDDILFDDWSVGVQNAGVAIITDCLFAFNEFTSITAASASLLMQGCRIIANSEDAGPLIAMSELAGSDNNVWVGNLFAASPVIVGTSSTAFVDSNVGVEAFSSQNNQANAGIASTILYFRNVRTPNSNLNFDTITIGGTLPYPGRRLTVHLTATGGAASTITMRDKTLSGTGVGGFELNKTPYGGAPANANLICANGEKWIVELRVNNDQTAWFEVGRSQIV